MKIFLTGATGFLGKSIVEYLPNNEYCLYSRGENVTNKLNYFSPDVIIHSAGEIYNELEMYKSNILLTEDILNWVSVNDVKLIYFGSSSEYGKVDKHMSESDECFPVSMYALTKLLGTKRCQQLARLEFKDIKIIRPFSVFGPNEPERRLIPTLYNNLFKGLPIKIIEGSHDFVYIKDFIRAVETILNGPITYGQIYNVGSGTSYTNREVFHKMVNLMGIKNPDVTFINEKKKCDSEFWICDNSKIKKTFDFNFEYTLDSGLREYIYWKQNLCQQN